MIITYKGQIRGDEVLITVVTDSVSNGYRKAEKLAKMALKIITNETEAWK